MKSHRRESTRDSIIRCNTAVTEYFHVSLKVYKSIKATVQLAAIGLAFVAIVEGADPELIFPVLAAILLGPEYWETQITNGAGTDDQ